MSEVTRATFIFFNLQIGNPNLHKFTKRLFKCKKTSFSSQNFLSEIFSTHFHNHILPVAMSALGMHQANFKPNMIYLFQNESAINKEINDFTCHTRN